MAGEIIITKKTRKNQDHKTISIRMKKEIAEKVEEIAKETGRSKSEVIRILLREALNCAQVTEE